VINTKLIISIYSIIYPYQHLLRLIRNIEYRITAIRKMETVINNKY
jgi:hypothetical protein